MWVNCWHYILFMPNNYCTYISATPTQCWEQFYKLIFSLSCFKVAAGATEVAVFGSASETFSKRNINCSIDESMLRFKEVINTAKEQQIPVRGLVYIVCELHSGWENTWSISLVFWFHCDYHTYSFTPNENKISENTLFICRRKHTIL